MIWNFLIVGLGGAIGSMLRHGVGLLSLKIIGNNFPWGTLSVNILGSFCIGLMAGFLAFAHNWSPDVRLFAIVGVLGGFTTFSAFSIDTILLLERGQYLHAILYVLCSVVISLSVTFAGLFLIRTITG